jgi:phosphoribosylaminoimidazolecarboxamide formyltransferase / IMP cyclohydrolase
MPEEKNALLSVYNKEGIVEFAQGLSELGWNLYSSGGTARKIGEADVQVADVSELVGGEAILGHRVVTLSREVHAGLLADKNDPEQMKELKDLKIPLLDLVCVDMYPLEKAIEEGKSENEVVEMTDVGGPTMLHSAAKGRRIVLSKQEQREPVLDWLRAGSPDEAEVRTKLAATAEAEVADYVNLSAEFLGHVSLESSRITLAESARAIIDQ